MTTKDLTVPEKLVLAAYVLEQDGRSPFSAEELVVSAWKMFPDTFGLTGYRDKEGRMAYPDSNRVFAEIMGSKPIRKRGLLRKVGSKMYQLTLAGREHAKYLREQAGQASVEKAGLPRKMGQELKRLLESRAVEKFKDGRAEDVTFYDACAFWTISPASSAIEFEERIANFTAVLETAEGVVEKGPVAFEHGGSVFAVEDLTTLRRLHEELLVKFAAEIDVIRKRKDERR